MSGGGRKGATDCLKMTQIKKHTLYGPQLSQPYTMDYRAASSVTTSSILKAYNSINISQQNTKTTNLI